jgi:hypothetical protein
MKITYLLLSASLLLGSCSNRSEKFYNMDASGAVLEPPPPPPAQVEKDASDETTIEQGNLGGTVPMSSIVVDKNKTTEKIKRTAYVSITVEDYKKARIAIDAIIKSGNAYIGNENEQNSAYSISNNMVIRVANKGFDSMLNKLLTVASHVNSKSITAEDVTAQFVDIQSRLKSKKEIEKRYLDILQKASKVSDILEIEENLGQIREEIEAKEGELKYLSDQVDYSTINLDLHQEFEYTPTDKPGFWGRLGNAFVNGWHGFLSFLVGFIYAWPLWILLGVGSFLLVKFIKRKRRK